MSNIMLDEKNKKRIQRYIKQEIGFYGYEEDIELLEQKGELTEALARKVFTKIMNDAQRIKTNRFCLQNNRRTFIQTIMKYCIIFLL